MPVVFTVGRGTGASKIWRENVGGVKKYPIGIKIFLSIIMNIILNNITSSLICHAHLLSACQPCLLMQKQAGRKQKKALHIDFSLWAQISTKYIKYFKKVSIFIFKHGSFCIYFLCCLRDLVLKLLEPLFYNTL